MSVSENSNKLFIHLGPQKTGSTSLQRFIRKNSFKLNSKFCFFTQENCENSRYLARMIYRYKFDSSEPNKNNLKKAAAAMAKEIRSQNGMCLLSNERYLGPMIGQRGETQFQPKAQEIVRILHEQFVEFAPIYVMYTREREYWIKSAYSQVVKNDRYAKTFKDYEAECEINFTWSSLVEKIESVVGLENLQYFPLEKEDEVSYPGKQLLSAMGLSDQDIHSLDPLPKKLNTSPNSSALEFMRRINMLNLNGKDVKAVRKVVVRSQELFDAQPSKSATSSSLSFSEIKASAPKRVLIKVMRGKPIGDTARCALRNPDIRDFVVHKAIDRLSVENGPKKQRLHKFVRAHLDKENRIQKALLQAALGKKPEARGMLDTVIEDSSLPAEQRKCASRWIRFLDNEAELDLNTSLGVMPRVFQFWDKNLPSDVQKATDAWRDTVGAANYRLYNDEEARELVHENLGAESSELYDTIYTPAIKADIFRYLALYLFGGVYIDADFYPQPNSAIILPQLTDENMIWARTDGIKARYTQWFLSAKQGWPSLKITLDRAFQNLRNDPDLNPLELSGPRLVTDVLMEQNPKAEDYTILRNGFGRKHLVKAYQPEYQKSDLHWKNAFKKRKAANKKSQT